MTVSISLHEAAEEGNIDVVKELVSSGQDINAFDEFMDWTPLHYAVKNNHMDVVRFLIDNNANVNAYCSEKIGDTPLGVVAENCSFDMAKILVDAGADPTIVGWMGISALDKASSRKKPEGVKVYNLLKNVRTRK